MSDQSKKFEVHIMGERFVVEEGAPLGATEIESANDIAIALSGEFERTVELPTTHGPVTLVIPAGGVPVWIKPLKSSGAQVW